MGGSWRWLPWFLGAMVLWVAEAGAKDKSAAKGVKSPVRSRPASRRTPAKKTTPAKKKPAKKKPAKKKPAKKAKVAAKKGGMGCPEVARYALRHNPQFRAMRGKLAIALQRLNGARVFPTNPKLEALGKGKINKQTLYKLEFALTWKFPIGGWWTAQQRAAKKVFERVKAELDAAQFSLILKSQKECFGLLLARRKVALYKSIASFYKRTYEIVRKRKKTGAATVLDQNFSRLELLQSRASYALAQAESRAQLIRLKTVMGWKGAKPPVLRDRLQKRLQSRATLAQIQQLGQRQHVYLRAIQGRIDEQEARLRAHRAKAIPDLKIKLYYAFEEGGNHVGGGGLALPIPLLWRNQSKIWTTQAKIRQIRLKMRAMRFKIRQDIARSHGLYRAGWRVFQLYETQLIPTMKRQIQLRERGLRLGAFTILQVISAQKSQNKAQLRRLDSLKQVINNYIALQKAAGSFVR